MQINQIVWLIETQNFNCILQLPGKLLFLCRLSLRSYRGLFQRETAVRKCSVTRNERFDKNKVKAKVKM
jgi:hypothetical protein